MNTKATVELTHPAHWLAVGLGSGLAPKAPGTFGTLAALPLVAGAQLCLSAWLFAALGVCLFAVGVWVCARTLRDWRGPADPGCIVFDEWVGLWLSFLALPFSWINLLAGFVLFRLFDILKPWPVRWADRRVHGGLGVMLDDALAGGMACLVLHGLVFLLR